MKIGPREKQILTAIQLQALASGTDISAEVGCPPHLVLRTIRKFVSEGIISPFTLINVYPLGFTDYGTYLSTGGLVPSVRQQLIDAFVGSDRVAWFAELGGDFQFGLSIYARNPAEFSEVLKKVLSASGVTLQQKEIAVRIVWYNFRCKYLSSQPSKVEEVLSGGTPPLASIDELDRQILSALSNKPGRLHSELAEELKIPASTLDYRLSKLKSAGVVAGFLWKVDPFKLGVQCYRMMLVEKGTNPQLSSDLYKFCVAHPNIVGFVACVGSWDFELRVEVESGSSVSQLSDELYQRFGSSISRVFTFPVVRALKQNYYPFTLGS